MLRIKGIFSAPILARKRLSTYLLLDRSASFPYLGKGSFNLQVNVMATLRKTDIEATVQGRVYTVYENPLLKTFEIHYGDEEDSGGDKKNTKETGMLFCTLGDLANIQNPKQLEAFIKERLEIMHAKA
jgi:hypothetical protein